MKELCRYASKVTALILTLLLFSLAFFPSFALGVGEGAPPPPEETTVVETEQKATTGTNESLNVTVEVKGKRLEDLREKDLFYKDLKLEDTTQVPIVTPDNTAQTLILASLDSKGVAKATVKKVAVTLEVCIEVGADTLVLENLFSPIQEVDHLAVGEEIALKFVALGKDEFSDDESFGIWPDVREKSAAAQEASSSTEEVADNTSTPMPSATDTEARESFDLEAETPILHGLGEKKIMTGLNISVMANEALPGYFSGNARITANWAGGHYSPGGIYYSDPSYNVFNIYVETPYGSGTIENMWCLEPGKLSAAYMGVYRGTAHFDLSYIDYNTNSYVYNVWVDFSPWQAVGEGQFWVPGPTGALQIIKQSSNNEATTGNDNYSLAGAVFRISNNTGSWSVETVATNGQGHSNLIEGLWPGWYSVTEIVAPKGYQLDPNPRWVEVGAVPLVGITRYGFADAPQGDPEPIRVQKLDATTGEAYGVDDPAGQNLAGAQFTWQYYNDIYGSVEEAQASGAPTRTWIIETKEHGWAELLDKEPSLNYMVSGSDVLYKTLNDDVMIPIGSVVIQETKAATGYLLPENPPVYLLQISMDPAGNVVRTLTKDGVPQSSIHELNQMLVDEDAREVLVEKYDKDTNAPIPDTEFTLYKESAEGVGDWQQLTTKVTDEEGKLTLSPVALGSYKLSETCPNPLYASAKESGELDRFFVITPDSTGEVQIFYDKAIQISCEVYKDTINVTSAAFKTFDEDYLNVNNIGIEEYSYRVGFRSTSNVRADEFTVIDPLENVGAGQVRLTQLWTPVSFGDTDGLFNLWYQTNLTDPEAVHSEANAMRSNPYNINNPQNTQVYPSIGWELWAENLSATETTHLLVSDLSLAEGEYITGVRYEYGSVEVGFTTSNTSVPLQQTWKPSLDWTPTAPAAKEKEGSEAQRVDGATGLYPAYYLVICPEGIAPPTEIRSTVNSQIARNVVLTDYAEDHVVTTTIEPFMRTFDSMKPEGFEDGAARGGGRFPQTGDTNILLLAVSSGIAVLSVGMLLLRRQRRNRSNSVNNNTR